MPRIGQTRPDPPTPVPAPRRMRSDRQVFVEGFRRSKRGNLWREYDGLTVTIFQRGPDWEFGWCISGRSGPRYSRRSFASEESAVDAVAEELEV